MPESPRPDATETLTQALRERILVIDGAMGTLIQGFAPGEAEFRGERFADWEQRRQGQQRPAQPHPAGHDPLDPPAVPRGRRRHRADQHVHRDVDRAGRLRHAGPRPGDQRGRGAAGPRGCATSSRRPSARGSSAGSLGPDQPDRLDQPRRQRPGRPQRLLRRAGGGVPRPGPGPRRRRRGPAARRDRLRHPQRQGRDLRPRDAVRGARPALAGDHLRHHHRRVRAHPLRPGDRGVLELRAPRPARSPSASTARSAPRTCGPTSPS